MSSSVKEYFGNVKNAVVSIFEGLSVTLSYCVRKPVTIQYPDRIPKPVEEMLPESYRGFIEPDIAICTGCGLCQRTCPIGVIGVDVERDPETKARFLVRFDTDLSRCMFCGLCVEACPTGALQHTNEFEASTASIINLFMRYVKPGERHPVYKPVKGEEAVRRPVGEAFREIRREWDADAPLDPKTVRGKIRWKPQINLEESHESGQR